MSQSVVPLRAYVQELPFFRGLVMLWSGLGLAILVRDAQPVLADATGYAR